MSDSIDATRGLSPDIELSHTSPSVDWPVFTLSGGFILLFVIMALINIEVLSKLVNTGYSRSTELFGAYWQILLLVTFLIGLGLAVSRCGQVRLGN
ncbi:MAG: BCCT family transporter, partial [Pseudomonadales bacterium]